MRSVVLAAYQGEQFIGEQLDSILPQLAPDDEIVVSDDASTDGTLTVIAQRRDPRIRILANDTRVGYVANFQRAIDASRGDSIFFSDQDDVWLPNKVATLDVAMQSSGCVASDAIVVDDRCQVLHRSWFEWRGARGFSRLSIYLKPPIIGATLACRRKYLEGLLPFPAGVPHDFWLTFNAVFDGELGVTRTPLILYRRHPNVLSVTATQQRRSLSTIVAERVRLIGAMLRHRLRYRHLDETPQA
ncbi:MAG: putative glycosyltransferase [Gammaproteobacteria bacterium]|nr:putative glycosyltransferase [Gammaproteobacteria bacterium]